MNRHCTVLAQSALASLLASLSATAQNTFVVPPAATAYRTLQQNERLLPNSAWPTTRVQFLYDVASIPLAQGTLTSLQLRPTTSTTLGPYNASPRSIQATITMSVSPIGQATASTIFANNHGPSPIQVFQGTIALPAYRSPPAWPAAWLPPIVFQSPFPYDASAGRSLVVDIATTGGSRSTFWAIEEYRQDFGAIQMAWQDYSCRTAANRQPGVSYNVNNLVVGGFLYQNSCCYSNIPSFAVNTLLFGVDGPGAPYHGQTLPVPLPSLGIPGNPACRLATAPLFTMPTLYLPGTGSSPTTSFRFGPMPIPNDPALVHRAFYTQHVLLDTDAARNNLVYTAPAFWWRIGSGDPIPASQIFASSATATTGHVQPSRAISLQLGY